MLEKLKEHLENMRPIEISQRRGIVGIFFVSMTIIYSPIAIIFKFSSVVNWIFCFIVVILGIILINILPKVGSKYRHRVNKIEEEA